MDLNATGSRKRPMSDLENRFNEAVDFIQNGRGDANPSNDQKLAFYDLYKQATEGDVSGKRPGMMDFVGRAKFDAWDKVRGLSREEAMERYVEKLEQLRN
jgi:acyl-CoA-binding protein